MLSASPAWKERVSVPKRLDGAQLARHTGRPCPRPRAGQPPNKRQLLAVASCVPPPRAAGYGGRAARGGGSIGASATEAWSLGHIPTARVPQIRANPLNK